MGLNSTSELKVIVIWICSELLFSILGLSIYYWTQSDIRVKSYCHLNLLRASVFNYECHNILRDLIGHPSKMLLLLKFAKSFCFQIRASSYITGYIRTSELNVIVVCICYEIPLSITSISIYYRTPSDIRVKSYCRLNLLRASVLNFECLDILRDSIRHSIKKLLWFEFATSFCFQLRASRYITGFIRTSELKVIAVCICYELPFSITSVSIYYWTQLDIQVKIYCRLNLLRPSALNFECLDILRDSIGNPSKKLLWFEFAMSFRFLMQASR